MKIKNLTLYSLVVFLIIGLNSCRSDSDSSDDPIEVTVTTSDFTTTIDENPTNGQVIGTVAGTTNQGSVTFSITEQTPTGAFVIDSNTGELTVTNGEVFDFANNPIITGLVKVANGSVFENAMVTININETIIIVTTSDFSTSIDENPTNGDVIGAVEGTTNQGTVTFSIMEQTPSGAFAIDSTTGEITVADETIFDFETNSEITGIVKVANGTVFENSNIIINLNDIEEANIYDGDVFFMTQQEVEDFGANNYTEVTGSVIIGSPNIENNSIVDLTPLNTLTTIGANLFIRKNNLLENLEGFNNLTSIGISLHVFSNDLLINFNGLNNLSSIGEGIYVEYNPSLLNIDSLSNITSIYSIEIDQNSLIENINGLNNITSNVLSIVVLFNPELINVDGLSNIVSVTEILWIHHNEILTDLCGIEPLIVGGGLEGNYIVSSNAYNPTQQDIIDGNCSQ